MPDFNRRESFDMKVGIESAQRFDQLDIPFAWQSRVQSSDHMNLGDSLPDRLRGRGLDLRNRHFKGMRVSLTGAKSAELTGENANIRIIDIPVQDVGRAILVFAPANNAGDLPQ